MFMKTEELLLKGLATVILKSAKKQADSKCILFGYEPKKPLCLKTKRS